MTWNNNNNNGYEEEEVEEEIFEMQTKVQKEDKKGWWQKASVGEFSCMVGETGLVSWKLHGN